MSNQVYPSLPGLDFNVTRTPTWSTDVRTTPSRREYRSTDQLYALRARSLQYEVLRARASLAELQSLEGFYNMHRGSLDSWLLDDPDDNTVAGQVIGIGDSSNKDFLLARIWGNVIEPVAHANSSPLIYDNGVLRTEGTHYNLVNGSVYPSDPSLVRFVSAPSAGHVITWTGTFYWRCRFVSDRFEFTKFLYMLWKTGRVELIDTRT